ncbi:MAG: hypothetical protein ACYTG5_04580 [Planctomycetota bacterium]|jgi:hypothetical protein
MINARSSMLAAFVLGGAFMALPLSAQSRLSQEELIEKRDAKMASEFIQHASWILDYDAAKAQAKNNGKPIFAYFTRSFAP